MTISIISPVYNSISTISLLVQELEKSLSVIPGISYEIILIDDGSLDKSWEEIEMICMRYPSVHGIKLSRNFGQHHSIMAGL